MSTVRACNTVKCTLVATVQTVFFKLYYNGDTDIITMRNLICPVLLHYQVIMKLTEDNKQVGAATASPTALQNCNAKFKYITVYRTLPSTL